MIGLSETTLLALTIAISSFTATPSAYPADLFIPAKEYVYVVKQGETLGSIAKKKYGDSAYWTTIWNDNDDLSNPNIIHSDLKLILRIEKPLVIDQPEREFHSEIETVVQSEFVPPDTIEVVKPDATENVSDQKEIPIVPQASPLNEEQIAFLGNCEAGMDPAKNTGNGYYGAFQFADATWDNLQTGYDRADLAPIDVQKNAVQKLLKRSSIFTQFPACSQKMRGAGLI